MGFGDCCVVPVIEVATYISLRMGYFGARKLCYDDLKLYTNDFSEENFIGKFQFGRVYRGKILQGPDDMETKEVTVKIWEDPKLYTVYHPEDNEPRLFEEVMLLQHETMFSHPKLMRLIGYCEEGDNLGIVYDFTALDSVYNLLLKDSFSWLQRINVALQFARLLEFLHTPYKAQQPYLVRNIDAAHLLLDEDYNIKLFDFGLISGGIFPDRRKFRSYVFGCYGYIDAPTCCVGGWSEETDVFAFGIVLLELIAKRFLEVEEDGLNRDAIYLEQWAQNEYEKHNSRLGHRWLNFSLVHQSLEMDSNFHFSDGPKITKLAMRCVDDWPENRPTMKQVVECLLSLRVIRRNADVLGVEHILHDYSQKDKLFGIRQCICLR